MRIAVCRHSERRGHEAGRALLDFLCREETGQAVPEIRTGDHGKPYFPDSDLHFSISHTRHHAVCALAHCPVGVDMEELGRPVAVSLAKRVLSPGEWQQYAASDDPDRAMLTFWVLKEAAVKLTGEGLRGFPNQTDFTLSDPRVREWDGCLIAVMTADSQEGEIFYAI